MQYKRIRYYLEKYLNTNIKDKVLTMYEHIKDDFIYWPASIKYHHNTQGGLDQHTEEVIYSALKLFKTFEEEFRRKLITESDVVLLSFLHDLDKIGKYKENNTYDEEKFQPNIYPFKYNYDRIDVNDTARIVNLCTKYNIVLNEKQLNALTFSHGGWSIDKGRLTPLATIIHIADLMSVTFYDKN